MKKKKILFISQVFYPEQFPINIIAQNIKRLRYDVDVITGYPTYPKFQNFLKYFKLYPSKSSFKKIKIYRVPIFPRIKNSFLYLFLNYVSFILSGILFSNFFLYKKKIDYIFVYATSPLLQALIGVFLKKIKKAKLVIWVQDLWPESLEYTGYIKNKFLLNLIKKIVKYIYDQSDLILVQSESFKKKINKITNKKTIILNNPSVDFFKNSINKKEKKFIYLYAGNVGSAQAIINLVKLAKFYKNNKQIFFNIVGSGSETKKIKNIIKLNNLENIKHREQVDYNEIKKEYKKSDILIAILKKHELSKLTIPSKIQAYMSAGKPILCCIEGEASDLIKKANCGFVSKSNVINLKKVIKKINSTKSTKLRELGKNGRKYFLKNFSGKIVTLKLDKILKKLK